MLLEPFPNLSILNLTLSNIQIQPGLAMLRPLQNKTVDGIYFRRVTGRRGTFQELTNVVITPEDMKYFNNICLRTVDISENNIVPFENNPFGMSKHLTCFENVLCTGNRFGMDRWAAQIGWFLPKLTNLKFLDGSYLPLQFPDPIVFNVYRNKTYDWVYEKSHSRHRMKHFNMTLRICNPLKYVRFTHLMAVGEFREFIFENSTLEHLDVSYFDTPRF